MSKLNFVDCVMDKSTMTRTIKTHPMHRDRKFTKKEFSEWVSQMACKQSGSGSEMAMIGGKWYSAKDIMKIINNF